MKQGELFEIPEQKPPKPKHRCRDCKHMVRHQYSNNFVYCSLGHSNRTGNGYVKVKKLQAACLAFEPKK